MAMTRRGFFGACLAAAAAMVMPAAKASGADESVLYFGSNNGLWAFRNYSSQYTTIGKKEMIAMMRAAMVKTTFIPPLEAKS